MATSDTPSAVSVSTNELLEVETKKVLAERYRLLFQGYAVGEIGPGLFKRQLVEWNVENSGRLRWDAALFLLVNLDRMLIRPYFGEILSEGNRLLPLPNESSAKEWLDMTHRATNLILEHLARSEGEISAHDVLQVIDANWETLALMFTWG